MEEKNVILYGIGKIQKDFEYIFDDISVIGYLVDSDSFSMKIWNDKPVYRLQDIKSLGNKIIIICDFDREDKRIRLEQIGLEYRKHFIIADDLFYRLDISLEKIAGGREIFIWGTGYCAEQFLQKIEYIERIKGCIDNKAESKTEFYGKQIFDPSEIEINNWKHLYIVVAADAYYEIREQLKTYGLEEKKDFIWFRYLVNKPSELLKKTIYDSSQYHLICNTMFHTYEIESTGEVSCCCTTFIDERIGNLIYQDFYDIWYSNIHKILCLSVANQTYTFCKKDMCPVLMEKERYEYQNCLINEKKYKKIEQEPKVLLISIDSSCNLYCESCRDCVKVLQGKEQKKAELMMEKLLKDNHLSSAEFIVMAGNGEVFLSKIYEKIWSSEKTKYIKRFRLLSNGTLFTKEKWDKFSEGRNSEIVITFSIDAATKETYQKVRRGGNYEQLLKNMEFASTLRQKGKLIYFQISFVVQRKNYQEIPMFVELGKRLKVDKVFFTRILNWGTYSEEEFAQISMTDKDGYANAELQEILNMPIMQESIVDLGTVHTKINEKEYDYIDNYYLWEIDRYLEERKQFDYV